MGSELKPFNPLIQHKANTFKFNFVFYYYSLELVPYWVNKLNDLRGGVRAGPECDEGKGVRDQVREFFGKNKSLVGCSKFM